jgi:hypothetical protein
VESSSSLRDDARTAWGFGIAAVLLSMVAPCMSYMPALIAVPLGLVAMRKAQGVLASAPDEATEVYARTGQILGIVGAVWSAILLLFLGAILLMYGGMFALILMEGL